MKTQVRGTLIIRRKGRFFKVITARRTGGNWWTFECRDLESRQSLVLKYELLGMLEAMDSAARMTKDPEDILLIDFDKKGEWKIVTKDQIERMR